uniref:H15 domain-containing protein n=1 Tax=Aplanochytrium stocchinoi TaxID=215587 RepID=A0A7S3PMS7_9STRA|mmetsp:Transcript_19138/g.23278  ORF Transcript_19138/g.23278 Transcript_19138/m.23278 type:complete len:137 (+) Transcript_19138:157-567(+)|eukprot:CAMPEP_0204885318 /NCGR_PEP_ID=MMETSP1349-20130617/12407_1 /ASSEMBLY_ACC=CAM_ASM_000710 /TAXON_ID=215587 /ORGANISM="Aplanochytrium stocchinoi, Strain GSBS06" /LENGTH=136 /DNA_ID=CAMNT_0052046723 /DNA_START=80 /DNA_END=490 /DNA_ORIENTATION=+
MTYFDIISKAIKADGSRMGSSLQAIKKESGLDASKHRFLNAAIAEGVKKGLLVKNKGKYKLAAAAKKPAPKKRKATKKASKKPAKKAKTGTKSKKTATKKAPAKKKETKPKKAPAKKKATKPKKVTKAKKATKAKK